MTIQEYFQKNNGKPIDYDGYYGNQCMDLYRQYVKECLEYPQSPGVVGAADVWTTYLKDYYERINNDPTSVPQLGDIIIWNKNAGGGFGHISVFNSGDSNNFISFDQNWPVGSYCHFQNHNYTNVLGWLRSKKLISNPPEAILTGDSTKVDLGEVGIMEIQAIKSTINDLKKGVYEYEERINVLKKSCDIEIKELEEKLGKESYIPTSKLSSLFYGLAVAIDKTWNSED